MYIRGMANVTEDKGLVIVYTGEGKGKTTAALGLALRAAGYKKKVLIVQFGKIWFSGEIEGVKKLSPYVKLIQGGRGFVEILNDKIPIRGHKEAALSTWEILYRQVISNKWDLVIADELIGAVAGKILPLSRVKKLIKDKPGRLDLVLTGRHLPASLLKIADLVTEMVSLKHPFEKGILAKVGIDY